MTLAVRTAVACGVAACGVLSCILVDPVEDLPKPPRRAPSIVNNGLFPPETQPLVEMPVEFVVPVRVPDPTLSFVYGFFVNGNGVRNLASITGAVPGSPSAPDLVSLRIPSADITSSLSDLPGCLRFEVVVALDWNQAPPEADPALSDSVSWWFVPDGRGNCGLFDAAALTAPVADAAVDGTLLPNEGGSL